MRTITLLAVVAVAAVVVGGALSGSAPSLVVAGASTLASDEGGGEFRGELRPDPETGCIELPDEPDSRSHVWPHPDDPDDDASDGPGDGIELHQRPWPRCDPGERTVPAGP